MANRPPQGMASTRADQRRAQLEERRKTGLALFRRAAPCRHHHNRRRAIRAANESKLHRQFVGRAGDDVSAGFENGSGLGERKKQDAAADARQFVQAVTHRRHDAKIAAAAAQRPNQFLIAVIAGSDDAAIGENDVGGEEIIESKPEAADQRPVAAAQGEAGDANAAA